LDIEGNLDFVNGARNLIFGADCEAVKSKRIASSQSISGTGAVNLGLEFIGKFMPREVHVSKPTWGNHVGIAQKVGLPVKEYTYYDPKTKGFDFAGMVQSLKKAAPGSVILLHPCAHNPTGVDPTVEQWKQICEVMKANNLIPFFDSAYQGFASGSLEKDIWPIRYFIGQGFNMLVSQSFAKNMGLYGERVGAIHIVVANADLA
jgi:aspartate aminotransferase